MGGVHQRLPKRVRAEVESPTAEEYQVVEPQPEPTPEPTVIVAAAREPLNDIERLMESVGIAPADWYYVNCVIAGCEGIPAEGGWDGVTKWNYTGSGAYGICQSLPAEKMASAGDDYMTSIETQLRWCHSYAHQYGGWKQAWEFRKCVGECYSPRVGFTVYKDHPWW